MPLGAIHTGRTALRYQLITLDFGTATQFGDNFGVNSLSQDGFTTGRLTGVSVVAEGVVFARFTNGQSTSLGKLALANFVNPQGLQQLGDTTWGESFQSGDALLGEAGTASFGNIQSGALEASNVDLTAQLVQMITAQRNFQANAQMISDRGRGHADGHQHPVSGRGQRSDAWTSMLYIAMTGAKQTESRRPSTPTTSRTSRRRVSRRPARVQLVPVDGPASTTRASTRVVESYGTDLSTGGSIQHTGRDLDVAIAATASSRCRRRTAAKAYTRAGDLRVERPAACWSTGAGTSCSATAARSRCRRTRAC